MQKQTGGGSLSRRALLASASTLILPTGTRQALSIEVKPTANGGRINLGLNGVGNNLLVYPFINVWKCSDHIQVTTGEVTHLSSIGRGAPKSAWDGYLDQNGELVRPLPLNVTTMERVFYAPPIDGLPDGYNRVGERWVLKWDGIASSVSVSGSSSMERKGNRVDWVWGSNTATMSVSFAGMDPNDPPYNIRLCEKRYESRIDAGEVFDPEWLVNVRAGSGIVRFMCWQNPNLDPTTLKVSDIPDEKYCSYGGVSTRPYSGVNMKPFIKSGMPLSLMSALANKVQSHPWVCIPNVLGTKKLSAITSISNTNPAVVTSPGHNWEDGDQVIPYGTNWPQIEKIGFAVTQSDQKAGTFVLAGMDSTAFGPFASDRALVTAPYDLNGIAKEVASFATHFRNGVAPGLITYFEFANETWNDLSITADWLAAQAVGKFGRKDCNLMSGYLAAHCMSVIRDTYGSKGRIKWRGVLATQTVNTYVTDRVIAGAERYILEHDRSLNLSDLFSDLAVTGYFGGNLDNGTVVMEWMDVSEQRWKDGLEPTKYSYFNRLVNDIAPEKLKLFWSEQKRKADAHGLSLIQYEGGNGNVPSFFGSLNAVQQARLMDFYKNSCHTAEDAKNYRWMFNTFAAMGGGYPAKFVEAGAVIRYGNWGGLRFLGDSNPVWDEVVAFNARS